MYSTSKKWNSIISESDEIWSSLFDLWTKAQSRCIFLGVRFEIHANSDVVLEGLRIALKTIQINHLNSRLFNDSINLFDITRHFLSQLDHIWSDLRMKIIDLRLICDSALKEMNADNSLDVNILAEDKSRSEN